VCESTPNLHHFYYSDHLYGMNYSLLVNKTGAGKNIVVNIVRSLLGDDYTIRTSIQSGPALIPLLTDNDLKNKTARLVVHGRPVILICSEWSRLVAVAGIEHSTVVEDLNDLHMRHHPWTFARSHKNSSGGDIVVMNPALTVVGTTTNKLFHAALTDRMIASGYVNRYLTLPGSAEFEPYNGHSHRTEHLNGTIDHLVAHAWGLGKELAEFYAPEAWKAFQAFQDTFILPLQRNPETSETLSRLHLHLHHVAALYAWQEKSDRITVPHFDAARTIIEASHAFVLRLLEERAQSYEPTKLQEVEAAMEQRAIAKLKQTSRLTRRELARQLSHGKGGYTAWAHTIEQLLKADVLFLKKNGRREELHVSSGF
jgi:Protein of unknown function (DUF3987)